MMVQEYEDLENQIDKMYPQLINICFSLVPPNFLLKGLVFMNYTLY